MNFRVIAAMTAAAVLLFSFLLPAPVAATETVTVTQWFVGGNMLGVNSVTPTQSFLANSTSYQGDIYFNHNSYGQPSHGIGFVYVDVPFLNTIRSSAIIDHAYLQFNSSGGNGEWWNCDIFPVLEPWGTYTTYNNAPLLGNATGTVDWVHGDPTLSSDIGPYIQSCVNQTQAYFGFKIAMHMTEANPRNNYACLPGGPVLKIEYHYEEQVWVDNQQFDMNVYPGETGGSTADSVDVTINSLVYLVMLFVPAVGVGFFIGRFGFLVTLSLMAMLIWIMTPSFVVVLFFVLANAALLLWRQE